MTQGTDQRASPVKVLLIVAAIVIAVVWAISTLFGVSLTQALAVVILLLFVTVLAAVVLGIAPF